MSSSDCEGCNKKSCLWRGWDWFSPQANLYCRSQFMWFLTNKAKYFDELKWPDNPLLADSSSHTDPAIRSNAVVVSKRVVEDFCIECEIRLAACGEAGQTLLEEVQSWGENLTVSIPYSYLSGFAKKALNYCCGKNRRLTPFTVWKAKQKEKEKIRV